MATFSIRRTVWRAALAVLAALALPGQMGQAAPGDPIMTFGGYGTAGRIITDPFAGTSVRDAAAMPDGRLVVVGTNGQDFIIARYSANGEPDPTFDADGVAQVDFGATDIAAAVAVQPDGKLVVAGTRSTSGLAGTSDFAIARLDLDGALDTTFDGDGKVTVDFNGRRDIAYLVIPYANNAHTGTILVGGSAEESSGIGCPPTCNTNMALVRLNNDGSLDSGWGTGGKVQTDLGASEVAFSATVSPYWIAVGGTRLGTTPEFVVAGYQPNGSPYLGTDSDAVVTGTVPSAITDLIWHSGLFLGAGDAGGDFGLLAITGSGVPDPNFGTDGVVVADLGGSDSPTAIVGLDYNSFAVAGTSGNSLALAQFDKTGDPVPGTQVLTSLADVSADAVRVAELAVVPDVRLWTIGSFQAGANLHLALTRHFVDGTADAGGRQAADFSSQAYPHTNDYLWATAFQPDGKLLVAGTRTPVSGPSAAAIARYDAAGQLDPSFADGLGQRSISSLEEGSDMGIQADDKIVVAGSSFDLARLNANGSTDTSFGTDGYATAGISDGTSVALAIQPDQKLVVAGRQPGLGGSENIAVARFTPSGALDSSFGVGGKLRTAVGQVAYGYDVAVQADGKIIVVGRTSATTSTGDADFVVVRYTADGGLDSSFGDEGRVITDFGATDLAFAVLVQPDGKIVAAGFSLPGGVAVARYHADGSLDSSFDLNGKLLLTVLGDAGAIDVAMDGTALVMAVTTIGETGWLVRLTEAGALDTSLNGNGRAPFVLGREHQATAVAVGDGRIALAGFASGVAQDFGLAMFEASPSPYQVFVPLVMRQ